MIDNLLTNLLGNPTYNCWPLRPSEICNRTFSLFVKLTFVELKQVLVGIQGDKNKQLSFILIIFVGMVGSLNELFC